MSVLVLIAVLSSNPYANLPSSGRRRLQGGLCTETCNYASDSLCGDGGSGSQDSACAIGTDCTDCGPRASTSGGRLQAALQAAGSSYANLPYANLDPDFKGQVLLPMPFNNIPHELAIGGYNENAGFGLDVRLGSPRRTSDIGFTQVDRVIVQLRPQLGTDEISIATIPNNKRYINWTAGLLLESNPTVSLTQGDSLILVWKGIVEHNVHRVGGACADRNGDTVMDVVHASHPGGSHYVKIDIFALTPGSHCFFCTTHNNMYFTLNLTAADTSETSLSSITYKYYNVRGLFELNIDQSDMTVVHSNITVDGVPRARMTRSAPFDIGSVVVVAHSPVLLTNLAVEKEGVALLNISFNSTLVGQNMSDVWGFFPRNILVSPISLAPEPLLPPPPPSEPPSTGGASGDPHLVFANGANADFRGSDDGYFSMVSFPDFAINFRTQQSTYEYNKVIVNGTFMTEIFIRGRTETGKELLWRHSAPKANANNWDWRMVNGTCGKKQFCILIHRSYECDDFKAKVDVSTSEVSFKGWKVRVTTNHVYNRISGAKKRIDIKVSGPQTNLSHGIIGQSFNHLIPVRSGRQDAYPHTGNFTTRAQAEGSIQGIHTDYALREPFQTSFKYSMFDAKRGVVGTDEVLLTSEVVDLNNEEGGA